nr:hypothetical protein Iba_chr14aCG9760 [Ipomoea batatas]
MNGSMYKNPLRESKSEPSFPAAFLLSQPALNRLDLTDALSTLVLISFLLRFKIADRTPSASRSPIAPPPPFAFFSLRSPPSHSLAERSPVAVRAGVPSFAVVSSVAFAHRPRRSPFAQAARPLPSCLRSPSQTALAGRRSHRSIKKLKKAGLGPHQRFDFPFA